MFMNGNNEQSLKKLALDHNHSLKSSNGFYYVYYADGKLLKGFNSHYELVEWYRQRDEKGNWELSDRI
jgi:hypothetical protein